MEKRGRKFVLTEQELLQSDVRDLTEREVFCLEAYLVNGDKLKAYLYSREQSVEANMGVLREASERFFRSDKVVSFLRLNRRRVAVADKGREVGASSVLSRGGESREDKLESYVRGLELVAQTGSANEQVNAYKALADIQQLKKLDMREDDERKVVFYLPLRCRECVLYREAKEGLPSDFELTLSAGD